MSRIRTLKPEWLDDEQLAAASDAARLMSVALILLADDYGNGRAHELYLGSRVFPYGEPHESLMKVSGGLQELCMQMFCRIYEIHGQKYFHIVNWKRHQAVQRPGKPRVPGPVEGSYMQVAGTLHADHMQVARLTPTYDHDLRPRPTTPDHDPRAPALARGGHSEQQNSLSEFELDERVAIAIGEFGRRYEAKRGIPWGGHGRAQRDLASLALWASTAAANRVPGTPGSPSPRTGPGGPSWRETLCSAMDEFFKDEWARGADYPIAQLAKQPGRYLAPPRSADAVAPEVHRLLTDEERVAQGLDPMPAEARARMEKQLAGKG